MNAVPDSLNLPGLRVLHRHETDGQYLFHVEAKVSLPGPCCLLHDHVKNGTKEQRFRDLPMHGKFVQIVVNRQRFQCRQCGATTYEAAPGLSGQHRMTERLAEFIVRRSASKTFADVAQIVGMSEGSVRTLFGEHMTARLGNYIPPTPEVLGIDEKHLNQRYRCVIGDVQKRALLDILPSRYKADLVGYFEAMPDRGRVRVVAQDMYETYRTLARTFFPRAEVVVDKFHVIQMANLAIEDARRRNSDGLSTQDRRTLKQQRSLFERRFYTLADHERDKVNEWLSRLPRLAEAYRIKEDICEVYNCSSKAEAIQHYRQWEGTLAQDTGHYFQAIPIAMKRWSGNIFAYFDHPYTNAYIESTNRLIGDLHRNGRGYSFPVLRAKALLSYGIFREEKPRFEKIELPSKVKAAPKTPWVIEPAAIPAYRMPRLPTVDPRILHRYPRLRYEIENGVRLPPLEFSAEIRSTRRAF